MVFYLTGWRGPALAGYRPIQFGMFQTLEGRRVVSCIRIWLLRYLNLLCCAPSLHGFLSLFRVYVGVQREPPHHRVRWRQFWAFGCHWSFLHKRDLRGDSRIFHRFPLHLVCGREVAGHQNSWSARPFDAVAGSDNADIEGGGEGPGRGCYSGEYEAPSQASFFFHFCPKENQIVLYLFKYI